MHTLDCRFPASLQGTKWTATKWIHNRPYGGSFDALQQAAGCKDEADDCE